MLFIIATTLQPAYTQQQNICFFRLCAVAAHAKFFPDIRRDAVRVLSLYITSHETCMGWQVEVGTETHGIIHVMRRCLVKFDISASLGKYTIDFRAGCSRQLQVQLTKY